MAKILVTGVNGFIGSHVAQRLLANGHEVRGLVRSTSSLKRIEHLDLELYRGDVTEAASLQKPVKGMDLVVHVAGLASDWGPYEAFHSVNVLGTQNLARAAAGVKRFVHISTTAIHGFEGKRNMDESSPLVKTIFPYCETKKQAEQWLFEQDLEVVAIRPGNVYGPRDHTFILHYLDALNSGKLGYVGGGRAWTCPTYVENLVDGILLACFEEKAAGEAFLITDGLDIDWRTFTDKLADALGVKRPRLSIPFGPAYGLAMVMEGIYTLFRISSPPFLTRYRISNGGRDYHFSIRKAEEVLGFRPAVDLSEAVDRTVDWYRNHQTY
jgi:nucleoside-diphosphate-sugar epimerase